MTTTGGASTRLLQLAQNAEVTVPMTTTGGASTRLLQLAQNSERSTAPGSSTRRPS
jgi:hypothetical protein